MALKYGLDIKTPTTNKDEDGWVPIMLNKVARRSWATPEDVLGYFDWMKASNGSLELRVVQFEDEEPRYRR